MTNAEIKQHCAIVALEQGKLTNWEKNFVESIRNYSKKQLRSLSSKQYDALTKIAEKADQ